MGLDHLMDLDVFEERQRLAGAFLPRSQRGIPVLFADEASPFRGALRDAALLAGIAPPPDLQSPAGGGSCTPLRAISPHPCSCAPAGGSSPEGVR